MVGVAETLLLLPQPLIVCGVPGDPISLQQVVGVALCSSSSLIVCGVPGDPGSLRQVVGVAGASVSLPCSSYHSLYPKASTALLMWFHEANTDPFYRCVGFFWQSFQCR